ncbi:MAG: 2OG-Fe(II) oxygenase [Geminicoccaceae bacterium]
MSWCVKEVSKIDRENLEMLVDGRLGGLVVRSFLDGLDLEQVATLARTHAYGSYPQVGSSLKKIGVSQSEFFGVENGEEAYFDEVELFIRNQELVDAARRSLLRKFSHAISNSGYKVSTLKGTNGRDYCAGVFRLAEGLALHSDWVPRDAVGWPNDDVAAQIAINLHISQGHGGGELEIFRRWWEPHHEQLKLAGYGYQRSVVEGAEMVVIRPKNGDLVLFNCRNFHEVRPVSSGRRVSFGIHAGFKPDIEEIVFWS